MSNPLQILNYDLDMLVLDAPPELTEAEIAQALRDKADELEGITPEA